MNYRHAFHAGNFADVIKHISMVAVLLHLRRKDKPFCVIDTHSGSGVLRSCEAPKRREPEKRRRGSAGSLRLADDPQLPEPLKSYLAGVKEEGEGRYPGSARIAARLLRPQDRILATERHREAFKALRGALAPFPNARAVDADGYERLPSLLPLRERRGVVLIDPPYETDDEFARVAELLIRAHRRFATGIYVAWYPIKSRAAVDALYGEVRTHGIAPVSRLEIETRLIPGPGRERLSAAGLLIINPPFGFDEEMRSVAAILAPLLGATARDAAAITVASAPG